ncbi:MAG: PadR family transcriptional regulator [Candidatus Marinimicrobia bacterium]|jgi:PadR family transcriptional regulator PadR|nr:PadR family transcriptional regulator [Candidatus Neomarinimicrobiota bacterium]MBT3496460.1 PadR family transcriptional regulator [Candidatus Neomarinimicrobiota bacterium]MBT4144622.1 PadR family transcriptional regulator [Candidatus Neomarinimicrobiota bacterium]MBT4178071.1 PadR family transcriptional regulator [Candidatus Neomarinimicrobiota bacterium]MBT4593987.1 PadR family transcriptional regulator [Candidatus Neomarinimicrobiota bacterium]
MFKQNDTQVLKGFLDTLILKVLSEDDNYGYAIFQKINVILENGPLVLKESSMYPILHRLESKMYLESFWMPGNRGTDRKYYCITELGNALLEKRIIDWKAIRDIINTYLDPS